MIVCKAPSFSEFREALEYLVSIEPDPGTRTDIDEYEAVMAAFEEQITEAQLTIRAYGTHIAPMGLAHMQQVRAELIGQYSDDKSISLIGFNINLFWDGCGDWRR